MGKAKKRSINLGKHNQILTLSRESAIKRVVSAFKTRKDDVQDLVTLFGLSAEELLEAGALYEDVKGIEGILND